MYGWARMHICIYMYVLVVFVYFMCDCVYFNTGSLTKSPELFDGIVDLCSEGVTRVFLQVENTMTKLTNLSLFLKEKQTNKYVF
jgi:hypothetical protein